MYEQDWEIHKYKQEEMQDSEQEEMQEYEQYMEMQE